MLVSSANKTGIFFLVYNCR